MKEMVTTVWFDRWLKDADERRRRRRQLEAVVLICANVLMLMGILMALVGVTWIDATDVCRDNVVCTFVGVGLLLCGSQLRFRLIYGGWWM